MKRAAIFYWLIGIAIAAIAIGAAFYLDDTVWHFILEHQNRGLRSLMRNVSRFGDWPSHVALGLLSSGNRLGARQKKWTRIFLSMLVAMAIAGIAADVIKRTFARPSLGEIGSFAGTPSFSTKYHSFPSGHVAASMHFLVF